MKKTRKMLAMLLSMMLVAVVAIGGTYAYLTSTPEAVTNTFTVGNVVITLDEAPVDAEGQKTTGARVKANAYQLFPAKKYDKDPTVHVAAGSEDCYVFVKVENGIAAIESTADDYVSILAQVEAKGWTALEGVSGVYYKQHTKTTAETNYVVFENFTIDENVQGGSSTDDGADQGTQYLGDFANATVKVTAYAIQAEGFTTAADAWTAGAFN